jgi:hypothetical protein
MKRLAKGRPSHSTIAAYLALFVALGGSAYAVATIGPRDIESDAVRSRHIKPGQVKESDLRDGAVTGVKVQDASLAIADLGWDHIGATVSYPAINAGQCVFVDQAVTGIDDTDSLLAYTSGSWDDRLMVTGVESPPTPGEIALQICNHSASNLEAASGSVFLIRF